MYWVREAEHAQASKLISIDKSVYFAKKRKSYYSNKIQNLLRKSNMRTQKEQSTVNVDISSIATSHLLLAWSLSSLVIARFVHPAPRC